MKLAQGDRVFNLLNYALMVLVTVMCLYPVYYCIIMSISNLNTVSAREVWIVPVEITWKNYEQVIKDTMLINSFKISLARTVVGAGMHVFCCAMAGYALSKRDLVFGKFLMKMLLVTMFFGGGLIPWFLLLNALKLTNNFWGFILPSLYGGFNIIMMRTFFRTIPDALIESATIDGAGYPRIFFQFILPLSKAVLATVCLFSAVYHWNDWFQGDMLMRDEKLFPLSTILMRVITRGQQISGGGMAADAMIPSVANKPSPTGIKMATVVIAVTPIMCVYPFLQRFFAKGVMIGSVKG